MAALSNAVDQEFVNVESLLLGMPSKRTGNPPGSPWPVPGLQRSTWLPQVAQESKIIDVRLFCLRFHTKNIDLPLVL